MKILIIEDQFELANIYREVLNKHIISSDIALNAKEAMMKLKNKDNVYDMILLDLNLPDMSGMELLQEIRVIDKKISVIIISAQNQDESIIKGLNYGADDYLVKPINFDELIARINVINRRKKERWSNLVEIENIRIDYNLNTVYVNDEILKLSNKEFTILSLLVDNYPAYVDKTLIFNSLYDEYYDENSSALRVHIYNLKKKLTKSMGYNVIDNEKNKGYRLCLKV